MSSRSEFEENLSHYQVLGLKQSANADEIKSAYRSLAQRYHPDRAGDNPQARSNFEAIQQAMTILLNDQTRREYDISLEAREARIQQIHYEVLLDELLMCDDLNCELNVDSTNDGEHRCVVYDCRCGNRIHTNMETILVEGFVIEACESCSNVFKFVDEPNDE